MEDSKIKLPYCTLDGVLYQLEIVNDVLRFPNNGRKEDDLSNFIMGYYKGNRKFEEILEYYTNSGSSYDLVCGCFFHYGINNHTVTQGDHEPLQFVLYREDGTVEDDSSPAIDKKKLVDITTDNSRGIEITLNFLKEVELDDVDEGMQKALIEAIEVSSKAVYVVHGFISTLSNYNLLEMVNYFEKMI